MECDLTLGGDGEPIEDYDQQIVESQEIHRCFECQREIPIGTIHEIVTGEQDEPIEWHTCMDCANISTAFQTEGRNHGSLWSDLEDSGGVDGGPAFLQFNSGCLARVGTVSAKEYLQGRYRRWLGLE